MKALCAALALTLSPLVAQADTLDMQSDWLELVKGERCETTGAQIMAVSQTPDSEYRTVMVKLPKSSLDMDMEEVRVVGQAPEEMKLPNPLPELETEWVDDYDNDHYGLLVKLREDQKTPFRLFFSMQGQGAEVGGVSP